MAQSGKRLAMNVDHLSLDALTPHKKPEMIAHVTHGPDSLAHAAAGKQ